MFRWFGRLDWSARGLARVVAWTVGAPVLLTVIVAAYDLVVLGPVDSPTRVYSMLASVGFPLLFGPPLFLFFTLKVRELAIAKEELRIAANTDSLTGTLNRGAFIAQAEAILTSGKETRGALLVIDADNFKVINDRFGHHAGDEALIAIARAIQGALRASDLVGRLGGEEFGVFLPGAEFVKAAQIAERIRDAIAHAAFAGDGGLRLLTVSVGGAMFEDEVEFAQLFRLADRRLYEAKGAGRNRVAVGPVGTSGRQAGIAEAV